MNTRADKNGREATKRNRTRRRRSGSKDFRIPNRVVLGITLSLANSGLLLHVIFSGLGIFGAQPTGGM